MDRHSGKVVQAEVAGTSLTALGLAYSVRRNKRNKSMQKLEDNIT